MFSFSRLGRVLLVVAPIASLPAQATIKLAYVDSRYIVNNAPGTPAAQAIYQKELSAIQAQVQRMSDSLDALTAAFNKDTTLKGPKRDERLKSITDRQGEYQQRYNALQQQAQDREAELMQPILDQIKIALEDVRTEMGLTMIFDVTQNSIVAADKNLNISDRVLTKLRAMPIPTIADKADAAPKGDAKGAKGPALGAPISAPAGIRGPGAPAAPKADSAKKKADSTAKKRPPQ
jgi:outer membrane protein